MWIDHSSHLYSVAYFCVAWTSLAGEGRGGEIGTRFGAAEYIPGCCFIGELANVASTFFEAACCSSIMCNHHCSYKAVDLTMSNRYCFLWLSRLSRGTSQPSLQSSIALKIMTSRTAPQRCVTWFHSAVFYTSLLFERPALVLEQSEAIDLSTYRHHSRC